MNGYFWKLDRCILILETDYKIILHFLHNPLFMNRLLCISEILSLDEKVLDASNLTFFARKIIYLFWDSIMFKNSFFVNIHIMQRIVNYWFS